MKREDEIKFMHRCLDLAVKAEGLTYPNPMVGSVIVYNGIIIGEGYHLKAGGPHAEVNAINSVKVKEMLKESTLFVNLEPCSHTGKTPPCVDLINSHKIPRVVIGTIDTSDKVSGKGIASLENAGCEVTAGILEDECRYLNRRFFTFHEKRRPYITLKWAQSADGYLDRIRKEGFGSGPVWITGKPERILVHIWRATEEAILVGAETVRKDNPSLNVREWKGKDPLRLILSSSGKIGNHLTMNKIPGRNVVFTNASDAVLSNAEKVILNDSETSARQITDYLFNEGIQSLMIEGGAKVTDHFISTGLWDEARIFMGDTCFGDGVKAPFAEGVAYSMTSYSCSNLRIIYKEVRQDPG